METFEVKDEHLEALQHMNFDGAGEALEILCHNLRIHKGRYVLNEGWWEPETTKRPNNIDFLFSIFRDELKADEKHNVELLEKYRSHSDQQGDYRLNIDGGIYHVKFRHAPSTKKATFKVHSLQEYVKNNVYIILIYGGGDVEDMDMEKARWGMISPAQINQMLIDKADSVRRDPAFGHKRCIKIDRREFKNYFKAHGFRHVTG